MGDCLCFRGTNCSRHRRSGGTGFPDTDGLGGPFIPVTDGPGGLMVGGTPPPKRSKLSLNRRGNPGCSSAASAVAVVTKPLKETTNTRFAIPITSPERAKAAKGVIPANTEASTRWAMKNFSTPGLSTALLLATKMILFHRIC
jgi:hypothetical protein